MKIVLWILTGAIGFLLIVVVRANAVIVFSSRWLIVESVEQLPNGRPYQAVIVPGAMVYSSGRLGRLTQDRTDTAVQLLESWIAEKVLVSGDNRTLQYNEVTAMRNDLVEQGIDPSILFQDFAWFDTYDTMYRARAIFRIQRALITTQRFHLPRAVYIANHLGIEVHGVVADSREYWSTWRFELREIGARVKAWLEITFGSRPKFLWPAIPIEGESNGWIGVPESS